MLTGSMRETQLLTYHNLKVIIAGREKVNTIISCNLRYKAMKRRGYVALFDINDMPPSRTLRATHCNHFPSSVLCSVSLK